MNFKKLIALVLAAVMTIATLSVLADGIVNPKANGSITIGDSESVEFANGTWSGTPDSSITVNGLDDGDTVKAYQLLTWDPTFSSSEAVTNTNKYGWRLTPLGETTGLTVDQLLDGISVAEAGTIATALASASATKTDTVSGNSWTYATYDASNAEDYSKIGLYYVKVAAKDPDTIYNPIIVSADFYAANSSINASEDKIAKSAIVKKSKIDFDKDAVENYTDLTQTDIYNDVKPGDEIPYLTTTTIPAYGKNYDNAVFTISDTFDGPIALSGDVTVEYGETYENTASGNGDTNVEITKAGDGKSFTVNFKKAYLLDENRGVTKVRVKYTGKVSTKVDEDFLKNVTVMGNTAKLTFSNAPGETKDKHDITRHYSFSIDGNAFGPGMDNVFTSELIKIGLSEDGTPLAENKTKYREFETEESPLAGAKFRLTPVSPTTIFDTASSNQYKEVTTGADGRIHFEGLDAGSYTLEEISAPAGYVRDTTTYTITITPHYIGDENVADDKDVKDVLESYDVTIKNNLDNTEGTASFIAKSEKILVADASETTTITALSSEDANNFIANRRGNELPSTGGIGTTLFYIIGGFMVVAAGIVLVSRRKAEEE